MLEKVELNVNSHSHHNKLLDRITTKLSSITVEPVIFLSIFSSTIYQLIAQNLYLKKACILNVQLSSSICDALASGNISGFNKSHEATVQKIVTDMLAIRTAILSFFPICLILFVGSWSDRHNKRKPFILAPIAGEMLCCASLILNVLLFYELPLIVTVLGDSLPLALLGGWPCLFIGIYTYVGARCDEKNRSLKMGFVSAIRMSGHSLGYSIAGMLFQAVGFIGFFLICIFIQTTAFCLGILLVKEERITINENSNGIFKDFFDMKYFKNSFKVCFNREPHNRRFKFFVIILLTVVTAGPSNGEQNVNYMNARYRFGWDAVHFGLFFSIAVVTEVFGCILGVLIISKVLKLDDTILGVVGFTCSVLANTIFALAPNARYFYVGVIFDMFRMVPYIGMRTLMSKIVPHHELGQSNSIFGLSESFMPFIFGSLYTTIYKLTIEVLPGTYFLVTAFMKSIGICLFLCLYFEARNDRHEKTSRFTTVDTRKSVTII